MHILLTDILTCPQCGPQYGLILLADRIEQRRVREGRLGCANCRTQFVIRNGAGFLGSDPKQPRAAGTAEAALRLAALMGLRQGSGYALLAGPAAEHAPALAALLAGIEVIAVAAPDDSAPAEAEIDGVNRIGVGLTLPFATAHVAGVVLSGAFADTLLEEGARVLAPVARLVLEPPPEDAPQRIERAGLRVLARDSAALVAGHV